MAIPNPFRAWTLVPTLIAAFAAAAHLTPTSAAPVKPIKPIKVDDHESTTPCVTISASADTTLIPGKGAAKNFGTSSKLFVTGTAATPTKAAALVRFGLADVPKGANILSATMTLERLDGSATGDLSVKLVAEGSKGKWNETAVTAASFPISDETIGPLVHVVPFSGSKPIKLDVTQAVIDWRTGAHDNNGFYLTRTFDEDLDLELGSRESAKAPELRVCYVPSPCSGKSDGTACSDALSCVVDGACSGGVCVGQPAEAGTSCRPIDGTYAPWSAPTPTVGATCDVEQVCDGKHTGCPKAVVAAKGTPCRESKGPCDVADKCDGASATCPSAWKPSSEVCRPAPHNCDIAEHCTGHSASCPPDVLRPSGYECRESKGDCDLAEHCSGTSATCPADAKQPSGHTCHASAGVCDVAEVCNGTGNNCPGDAFKSSSTVCRTDTGVCDIEDKCTGSSANCPSDKKEPDGKSCGSDKVCDHGSCTTCGDTDDPCCDGSCDSGNVCVSDECEQCGGAIQPCCASGAKCPGSTEENPLTCEDFGPGSYGRCQPCGKQGLVCCDGGGCIGFNLTCENNFCKLSNY